MTATRTSSPSWSKRDSVRERWWIISHPPLRDGYIADPADSDRAPLLGRRATFEYVVRRWLERAVPVTKVSCASKISNRWTRLRQAPGVLGFFFLGDSAFEANPIYGRGCAAAFLQSHLLAEVLTSESDCARRLARFDALLRAELLPYHDVSVKSDRLFHVRANRARGGHVSVQDRLQLYGYERVLVPAVFSNLHVAREILNVMSMGRPAGPRRVFAFIRRVLGLWLRHLLKAPALLPAGPSRTELLQSVERPIEATSPPIDG